MATAPAPGAGVPADQAFVNNLITQSTTAGPWIDINTNYLLTSAYLVFFMHCGFAMVSPALFCSLFKTDLGSQQCAAKTHQSVSLIGEHREHEAELFCFAVSVKF